MVARCGNRDREWRWSCLRILDADLDMDMDDQWAARLIKLRIHCAKKCREFEKNCYEINVDQSRVDVFID